MKQYLLCTLSLLFLVHLPLAGQDLSRKFGRITDYEIDMTTYQRDTSAVAVCLYENTNVLSGERHYSTKIKILKPDGVDLANVEIPYIAGLSAVTGLSVSAYNRVDGKVVQTKLKNSEVRTEQVLGDLYIRKFAIPEVRTGTVIEYKYTIS